MKKFILMCILAMVSRAEANITGTDYQNFNPTSNGLDFVTVQSSETLKPGIFNMGLFANYAANSLTYSRTLNATYENGQKRKDRSTGMDLSLGIGLGERWDFGISVPVILSQTVQDNHYVSSLDSGGVTEVRANTKYRFLGDERGGLAVVASLNKNLIEDNPFAGRNPGLTTNLEFAADTTLANAWAVGANVGFRKRNPGSAVPGPLPEVTWLRRSTPRSSWNFMEVEQQTQSTKTLIVH
jgi:OmpA-OmpF porin, OOP family